MSDRRVAVIVTGAVVAAGAVFLAVQQRTRSNKRSTATALTDSQQKQQPEMTSREVHLPQLHGKAQGLVISSSQSGGCLKSWAAQKQVKVVSLPLTAEPDSCDVICIEDPSLLLDDTLLATALASLKANGKLYIASGNSDIICSRLALAGFVNYKTSSSGVIEGEQAGRRPVIRGDAKLSHL